MSHDFLTSLHSQVIGVPAEKPVEKSAKKIAARASKEKLARKNAVTEEERHRTIGVSMAPQLHERAAGRAREVGLSFSRYVQWCIEAELDGEALAERFKM